MLAIVLAVFAVPPNLSHAQGQAKAFMAAASMPASVAALGSEAAAGAGAAAGSRLGLGLALGALLSGLPDGDDRANRLAASIIARHSPSRRTPIHIHRHCSIPTE